VKLKIHREKHHQNIEPQGSQRGLQTLVYSFAKIAEWNVQWKCWAIPSVQPWKWL